MINSKSEVVLVTGGVGYIGSHTVVKLLESGKEVVILDNLSNSKREVLRRIELITKKRPDFVAGDIRDRSCLKRIFKNRKINSVIHFAGLKAVGESEADPLIYYDNNIYGSLLLLEEMLIAEVRTFVFSSSATVYGAPDVVKYTENLPLKPINVYGRTKLVVEDMLRDLKKSDNRWQVALLRYFNPVGAHVSGMIGEDPSGTPNNLMPFIAQVAIGKRSKLNVFGGDYPTPDGTGMRDFIHVEDLAQGHLSALNYINQNEQLLTVNLGAGHAYSVLELVKAFTKVSKRDIPYEIVERRAGDLPEYYADPSLAKSLIGWQAHLGIDRMCADTWRWQSMNPNGY